MSSLLRRPAGSLSEIEHETRMRHGGRNAACAQVRVPAQEIILIAMGGKATQRVRHGHCADRPAAGAQLARPIHERAADTPHVARSGDPTRGVAELEAHRASIANGAAHA
jgi:hypothetical protein